MIELVEKVFNLLECSGYCMLWDITKQTKGSSSTQVMPYLAVHFQNDSQAAPVELE